MLVFVATRKISLCLSSSISVRSVSKLNTFFNVDSQLVFSSHLDHVKLNVCIISLHSQTSLCIIFHVFAIGIQQVGYFIDSQKNASEGIFFVFCEFSLELFLDLNYWFMF